MYESDAAHRYVRALTKEISRWIENEHPTKLDTVYFGGGTPSLLTTAQIEDILRAINDRFEAIDSAEITAF